MFVLPCHGVGLKHGLGYGVVWEVRRSISDAVVDHDQGMDAPVACAESCRCCKHDAHSYSCCVDPYSLSGLSSEASSLNPYSGVLDGYMATVPGT